MKGTLFGNRSAMMEPTPNAPKALLLEHIHRDAREMLERDGFRVETEAGALETSDLAQRLPGVHVLGIRSKTQVREAVLRQARDLLAVGCFCIGTDQVDLSVARHCGVAVFNAPFGSTRSVAELVIGEIIALSRQFDQRSREMHEGQWHKVAEGCFEVRGKTLGVVGFGRIGSQLGLLAEQLGMRVLFFDITKKLPLGNIRPTGSLAELLPQCDFVSLHVPETAQTRNLVGAAEIAAMRPGSYLINASRGSVVDLGAMADGLRRHHLAGAAIDVYPTEPGSASAAFRSELTGLPNVILTPHIGGSTVEAQEAIAREAATSLIQFLRTGATTGAVNLPGAELPASAGTHRVVNVHRNVPGVLRDINRIVSDVGANIHGQVLATDAEIGYLIMDLDQDVAAGARDAISKLETSIRTRVLY